MVGQEGRLEAARGSMHVTLPPTTRLGNPGYGRRAESCRPGFLYGSLNALSVTARLLTQDIHAPSGIVVIRRSRERGRGVSLAHAYARGSIIEKVPVIVVSNDILEGGESNPCEAVLVRLGKKVPCRSRVWIDLQQLLNPQSPNEHAYREPGADVSGP